MLRPLPGQIFGPDGTALTLEALPQPKQMRWSRLRKGRVVAAVRSGLLTMDEACARYAMSVEEFLAWEAELQRGSSGTADPGKSQKGGGAHRYRAQRFG